MSISRIQNFMLTEEADIGDCSVLDPNYETVSLRTRKERGDYTTSILKTSPDLKKNVLHNVDSDVKQAAKSLATNSAAQDKGHIVIFRGIAKYGSGVKRFILVGINKCSLNIKVRISVWIM